MVSKTPKYSEMKKDMSTTNLGPGSYDPNSFITKSKVQTVNFSNQTKRPSMVSKDEVMKPGPGNYEQHMRKNSQSFTIGKRIEVKQS